MKLFYEICINVYRIYSTYLWTSIRNGGLHRFQVEGEECNEVRSVTEALQRDSDIAFQPFHHNKIISFNFCSNVQFFSISHSVISYVSSLAYH